MPTLSRRLALYATLYTPRPPRASTSSSKAGAAAGGSEQQQEWQQQEWPAEGGLRPHPTAHYPLPSQWMPPHPPHQFQHYGAPGGAVEAAAARSHRETPALPDSSGAEPGYYYQHGRGELHHPHRHHNHRRMRSSRPSPVRPSRGATPASTTATPAYGPGAPNASPAQLWRAQGAAWSSHEATGAAAASAAAYAPPPNLGGYAAAPMYFPTAPPPPPTPSYAAAWARPNDTALPGPSHPGASPAHAIQLPSASSSGSYGIAMEAPISGRDLGVMLLIVVVYTLYMQDWWERSLRDMAKERIFAEVEQRAMTRGGGPGSGGSAATKGKRQGRGGGGAA